MKKLFIPFFLIFIIFISLYSIQEISPYLQKTHVTPSDNIWDIIYTFETSAAGMPGIESDGVNIYTTTWDDNIFSRYEMDGTYLEDFTIMGVEHIRDMAHDGTYFYGSPASMKIYIMDLDRRYIQT
ncbi:MAG: hypothetical protein P9L97_04775 [Candidatus Tenebribacter davisii]|jgi:hypothetical protein|nr:hypothetical protein [Candidatus Tenebribacter davisii]